MRIERKKTVEQQVTALRSNAQVRRMYLDSLNRGWWKDRSEDGEVLFYAMAEFAIRKGTNPLSYFYAMVRNGSSYPIPEMDYDIGWRRYKEIHFEDRRIQI